jgi:hypothetical protein
MKFFGTVIVFAALALAAAIVHAKAQGIYMGRDGRAHAQVIVDPDGRGWPVAPTFCSPGFGPCPVVLGPPIAPPLAYAPPAAEALPPAAPPAPPIGWVYGPYTVCGDPPACTTGAVSVAADGLNVRAAPDGPPLMALVNGTPLIPVGRRGRWILVAAGCNLTPTFAWSWTAGVPLNRCWVY